METRIEDIVTIKMSAKEAGEFLSWMDHLDNNKVHGNVAAMAVYESLCEILKNVR